MMTTCKVITICADLKAATLERFLVDRVSQKLLRIDTH